MFNFFFKILIISLILIKPSFSEVVKKIDISGNKRITSETINVFSSVSINDNVDSNKINFILKELYNTGFFKDVKVEIENNTLKINVIENPIIQEIKYEGIKAQKIRKVVLDNLKLRPRSSFNEIFLDQDKKMITTVLRSLGYYFSKTDIYLNELDNNKVNITFNIEMGKKAKIKKISFVGNKIYKDKKLKRTIISEEYKFWKFISGKKYLNENLINVDNRLLKNFYLNKGYYNSKINSSFAKLINDDEFELIYNIDAGEKVYFGDLKIELPIDYNKEFDITEVQKAGAIFDMTKLDFLNSQHMANLNLEEFIDYLRPFLESKNIDVDSHPKRDLLIDSLRSSSTNLDGVASNLKCYFHDVDEYNQKAIDKFIGSSNQVLIDLKERLENTEQWDESNIDKILSSYREEKELSVPKVNQPLRIALTGSTNSPSLGMTLSLFEKKEALLRIEKLINLI